MCFLLSFSRSRGPPKSLVEVWNRLPRRAGILFSFKELLYELFSKRDPRVWTTPSTSGKRWAKVWGWSASPFCQSTCHYYYYNAGAKWKGHSLGGNTLDVHAGECPFAVRKGSPEELGQNTWVRLSRCTAMHLWGVEHDYPTSHSSPGFLAWARPCKLPNLTRITLYAHKLP